MVSHKKCEATLKLIHEGHLGLGKCKLRAKDTVYWPDLNDQLEKLILNCELYLKYSYVKHKSKPTTSLGQEIPVHPWSKLATDIFHFEEAAYLIIVNYTSRFPIVHKLTSMTGICVANQCKLGFSEYRWPEQQTTNKLWSHVSVFISDNGPCYASQAFTSVMQAFIVNHITSSPHYPQSNSPAEKYVQIVKCLFNKAKEEGKDFYKCFVIYHNTHLTGSLQSSMQILHGRNARSDFPMSNAARNQLGIQPEVLRNIDKHEKLPIHDLHIGQHVLYQDIVTK